MIRVINLNYSQISKKVTNLVWLRSLGNTVTTNYHARMHIQFKSVKQHYKTLVRNINIYWLQNDTFTQTTTQIKYEQRGLHLSSDLTLASTIDT